MNHTVTTNQLINEMIKRLDKIVEFNTDGIENWDDDDEIRPLIADMTHVKRILLEVQDCIKGERDAKMKEFYYTRTDGRRSANGHVTSRGTVFTVENNQLVNCGDYIHQSGGADIERSLLSVLEKFGVDTNGGYYKKWSDKIAFICLNDR